MTTQPTPGTAPVLVGVDGSPDALAAVRWAAVEAGRRRAGVRLVTAFFQAQSHVDGAFGEPLHRELLSAGERRLDDAAAEVARAAPGLPISTDLITGYPMGVLEEQARHAQLLVLGSRGLGGVAGLLAGSVVVGLSARAACPVVVVRGAEDPAGPVVVGVDGTPNSEAAVAFAYEAAAVRGVPLVAVHTWTDVEFAPAMAPVMDWRAVADEEEVVLAERLAGWGAKYPDVPVRRVIGRDGAARTLVELSEDAQLVVVGSRGRGAFAGLVLGSVSHAVLHRSRCPVAVVRPDTPTAPGSG